MKVVTSLHHVDVRAQILKRVEQVALSGSYTEGMQLTEAETRIGTMYSCEAVGVNSAGAGLFALGSYLHDKGHTKVYVQNNTFVATASMMRAAGLYVWLVDSRHDCPSMSVDSLKEVVKKGGHGAVVLTHVGGWLAKDYEAIASFCKEQGLPLIVDGAHAFGVEGVAKYGLATVFSFYPTKAVPIGEGGMVVTEDLDVYSWVYKFRNYGKYMAGHGMKYGPGFNLRMDEWSAAVLNVQLDRLPQILAARAADAQKLMQIVPVKMPAGGTNWYKYPVSKRDAKDFQTVGAVYAHADQLLHALPAFTQVVSLDNSTRWASEHVCLPMGEDLFHDMTMEEVRKMICK